MNYLFLADGFEEIEAITVIDMLRRAGIPLATVSITDNVEVAGAHDIIVHADATLPSISVNEYSALILPGGEPGTTHLEGCVPLATLLTHQYQNGALLAAICAAPRVLGGLDILDGHRATCFPGVESGLGKAIFTGEAVVTDDNIITAKGAGTAIAFAHAIIQYLRGNECADAVTAKMQFVAH